MWLQSGDVPVKFRPLQHITGVLLNVATAAGFRYKDNDIDLSQCIGFTQHETLMVNLGNEGTQRIRGTVMGLITPRSASMKMSEIAKGRLFKEVMRAQAHHYIVVPDFEIVDPKKAFTTLFYKKMWGVQTHQRGQMSCERWGEFISYIAQFLFRMDHPTDLSVMSDAADVLERIMHNVKSAE